MPFKRSPMTRLSLDEQYEIAELDRDIQDLWVMLGGRVCDCGKLVMNECARCDSPSE